ncbi:MAG: hypothetical protein WBL25_12525, partial [Anaerolineales bacterium]
MLLRWLIFIHVLSVITFFLAHGTSVAMAFQLRKETNIERIRAMLELSSTTLVVLFVSFLVMGLTGLIMPFILKIWGQIWVWLSIVLMVYVFIHMSLRNNKTYYLLRKLVGLPYRQGNKDFPAEPPASEEEILAHIRKISVYELIAVGYVI